MGVDEPVHFDCAGMVDHPDCGMIERRTFLVWLAGVSVGAVGDRAAVKPPKMSRGKYSDVYSDSYLRR
jgi:hypothetical protein